MTTWTTEQQQAIDIHGRSLLVAAAAGSGKTAVLVERIIQMISDESNPVDIDQLLVVTFIQCRRCRNEGADWRCHSEKTIGTALVGAFISAEFIAA